MAQLGAKEKKSRTARNTRRRLIDAAFAELVEGKGDLEVARVARRADVSDGLAYYHFGHKAGLMAALVEDFYARLDDAVAAVPFEGEDWVTREHARVREFVRVLYEDPAAVLLLTHVVREPGIAVLGADRQQRMVELGARNIAAAQRAGDISSTYDPKLLVSMILAGVTAGVTQALRDRKTYTQERVFEEAWGFVIRAAGIAGPALPKRHREERTT